MCDAPEPQFWRALNDGRPDGSSNVELHISRLMVRIRLCAAQWRERCRDLRLCSDLNISASRVTRAGLQNCYKIPLPAPYSPAEPTPGFFGADLLPAPISRSA